MPRHMQTKSQSNFEMGVPSTGSQSTQRSPISISLLFFVVTVGAILSACLRTLVGNESITSRVMAVLVVTGVVVGFISGGCLGMFGYKSAKAAGICSLVGLIVGAVAGGLAAVSGDSFGEIALIAFGGCWLLILSMLISARFRGGEQAKAAES